ncbi:class I SAM-dependent methyltransferase [Candidatus Pantoea soli]|uniref:Class I SAM-dependent methyltransferase n=1 Tax=Candidatus Pantoea soli TaxID=3098669 RepID=A0A518XJ03_9GAMM|nr:class I SAM-dependent methyltransferase [Pantoea soli]QDY44167.1 class I SAM-dependent methyltransferase [Pantoea soli]
MDNAAFKAVINLYERHAQAFAALRPVSLTERPWLDRFIRYLPAGGHVLDIGCGTGSPVAEYLLGQGFRVTGIDSSPSMIALCRDKFPQASWKVADMRQLDLGKTFDGILAWDSFFHLCQSDQRDMFALFSAHARPGTVLMFNTGPEAGEAFGQFQGETLAHASLSPEEYASLMQDYDFQIVRHSAEDKACNGRTLWLAVKSVPGQPD